MDNFMTIVSNGIPFHVRLVRNSECYGLRRCLTHDKDDPLVEFYDARFVKGFESLGQFVSRYYLSTLTEGELTGLLLNGEIKEWYITKQEMDKVIDWLKWTTKEETMYT